jgi:quinol monooxygenase YgiN
MIRHLVLWKLAADADEDKRLIVAELQERFAALAELDGVMQLEIRADIGETDGNWDVVLQGDYHDTAALDAYQVHPAHQDVVAYVRSVVTARACIDFEV